MLRFLAKILLDASINLRKKTEFYDQLIDFKRFIN
jgi:hypothetical protein